MREGNQRPDIRYTVILILCFGLLTGCSWVQLSYNFADVALNNRVAAYLLIDDEDTEHLNTTISVMMGWHRTKMLSKYAVFVQSRAEDVESGLFSLGQIRRVVREGRALFAETVEGAAPFVSSVLVRHVSPPKIAYLEARLAEREAKQMKIAQLPEDERLKNFSKRWVDYFERFTGPLSTEQRNIIRQHGQLDLNRQERWHGYRAKRRAKFLDLLRRKPSEVHISDFLVTVLNRSEVILGATYRVYAEEWWERKIAMCAEVLQSLNADQITELGINLRSLSDDFRQLSKQS